MALLIVAAASALRIAVFSELGRATAYLTYYPAVVLAALFGGLYAGLLATSVSALLCFYWIQKGYMSHVETLAMGAFIISCSMISGISEAMLRAKQKAKLEKERAEAANLAKSAFLARMSHELRTPMNAILGFAEILRRDTSITSSQQENLRIISNSGKHLLSLINDVLDMAKIDAGRMTLENSAFDLHHMVQDIIDLMGPRAEAKNLAMVLDQSTDLPRFVNADETKLRQILINLVGNAIKFTDQGSITLLLHAQPDNGSELPLLLLEVADTGIGISAADREVVFDPFIQVSSLKHQKGTGLGLAITRKFVELMGGKISVQSALGKGSIFRVEIPIELAKESEVNTLTDRGRIVGLTQGQPEYRILIVEDQAENSELLRQMLEPVGFQVRVAEDGMLGVKMFETWRPHFIWMDIRMPVMDGLEATRRIRTLEGGRNVRIVAVTASVFKEEIDNVKVAGMDDLIRKPFQADAIYDCLEKHLGVTYIREEATPASEKQTASPQWREALKSLPETLQGELADALVTLNADRISAAIGRIAELNPALGEMLEQKAGQFNYTEIMNGLKADLGNLTEDKAA